VLFQSLSRLGFKPRVEQLEPRRLLAADSLGSLHFNSGGYISPLEAPVAVVANMQDRLGLVSIRDFLASTLSDVNKPRQPASAAQPLTSTSLPSGLGDSSQPPSAVQVGTHGVAVVSASLIQASPLNADANAIHASNALPTVDPLDTSLLASIRLETTDLNGTPISSIPAGIDFKLEALVKDLRSSAPTTDTEGVFGAYLDVTYDANLVTVPTGTNVVFDPFYNHGENQNLSTPGSITETGAFAGNLTGPGFNEHELWSVVLHAQNNGSATFVPASATQANHGVVLYGLDTNVPVSQVNFISTTLQIGNVNHAPVGASNAITMAANSTHTFTASEFGFSDPNDTPPNTLLAVKITTLPTAGSLTDNGVAVTAGQFVAAADITGGLLKFTPAAGASGTPYASFTFQVQDNGGTANGGADLDPSSKMMTVNVTTTNSFVAALYKDVLKRDPDTDGLNFYTGLLAKGALPSAIVADVWQSAEHRGIEVDSYYQTLLHRTFDPAGRQVWVNRMLAGMSEEAVMAGFLGSSEYQQFKLSSKSFVDALYQDVLSRPAEAQGESNWMTSLTHSTYTRLQVFEGFINSRELHLKLIDSFFSDFLNGAPDTAGLMWVDKLDHGLVNQQFVAEAILSSQEFINDNPLS
jgi:hypothetical protein